jgi:hypothetical protein
MPQDEDGTAIKRCKEAKNQRIAYPPQHDLLHKGKLYTTSYLAAAEPVSVIGD